MIGLAVQLLRLFAGILKLTAQLLLIIIKWGIAVLRRRSAATHREAGGEPAARRDPAMPSRRRAFTAPRRSRRTTA